MDQPICCQHAVSNPPIENRAVLISFLAFQILYAKFYTFFNVKWVFLTALSTFEIGSLVCAVSPTSNTLIIGRAIAGLGACAFSRILLLAD